MSITLWQRGIDRNRLPSLIDMTMADPFFAPFTMLERPWSMPEVDLRESGDRYTVSVTLPGFRPEDISVEAYGRLLTIAAEREERREEDDTTRFWRLRELRRGQMQRTIMLPTEVDADAATCAYRDGVLTITLPKLASEQRRRIPIQPGHDASREGSTSHRWPRWLRKLSLRRKRS